MRMLLLSLLLLAWAAGPVPAPPSEPDQAASSLLDAEFASLHAQASSALEQLRQADEKRMTAPAAL